MAAYATAERMARTAGFPQAATDIAPVVKTPAQGAGFEALIDQLVELVAERVAARLVAPVTTGDEWLDTREAAEYLGVHRDTVRRLAAEHAVPSEQEGPGCKLFFRRSDLDAWRCGSRASLRLVPGVRS